MKFQEPSPVGTGYGRTQREPLISELLCSFVKSTIDDPLPSTMGDAVRSIMVDMTLGERVTKEREALGLNQPELAKLVETTKQGISKIENGRTKNPTLKIFFALARTFEVTPEWLAFGKAARAVKPSQAARFDTDRLRSAIGIALRRKKPLTVESVMEAYLLTAPAADVIDMPDPDPPTSGGSSNANVSRTNDGTRSPTRRSRGSRET